MNLIGNKFALNSLINAIAIISNMVALAVVTPIVASSLDKDMYSVWTIGQQLGMALLVLSLNGQSVLSRRIALSGEDQDKTVAEVAGCVILMCAMATMGGIILLALSLTLGLWVPEIPPNQEGISREAILGIGTGILATFCLPVLLGYALGRQRVIKAAMIQIFYRLGVAITWAISALMGLDVATIAWNGAIFSLTTTAIIVLIYINGLRVTKYWKGRLPLIVRAARAQFSEGAFLSVWSICGILFSTSSIFIVARFDFAAAGAFGTAFLIVAAVNSMQGAIMGNFLAVSTVKYKKYGGLGAGKLAVFATALNLVFLSIIAAPLILWAPWWLSLWLPNQLSGEVYPLMVIMLVATVIRSSTIPYAYVVVSTGAQRKFLTTPIIEAVITLALCLCLVVNFGAIGVAYGWLIGSWIPVIANPIYNFKIIREVDMSESKFIALGLLWPMPICSLIFFVAWLVAPFENGSEAFGYIRWLLALIALVSIYKLGQKLMSRKPLLD